MNCSEVEAYFQSERERIIDEWKRFLSFASISTDPEYDAQCRACAEWLREHVQKIGLNASLRETGTKPVVYAEHRGAPDAPTVTIYGHYDVQPVEPLERWTSDPFQPEIRDGRMYARGAQDNKGQIFSVLKGLEFLLSRGALRCTVKLFIEGEEECGSGGIARKLDEWRDDFRSDILYVADTATLAPDIGTITMGLRGILSLEVRLSGPRTDLHSGVHGGAAPNPAQKLVELLASLHAADGSIAVADFLSGTTPPAPEDLELAKRLPVDPQMYEQMTGVPPVGGESGYSLGERLGFRPTIEINGLISGHTGAGMKTIIPAGATAKLSARLAAGQDPQQALDAIVRHLEARAPEGLALDIRERETGGRALMVSSQSPHVQHAAEVLGQLYQKPVVYMWLGASIPVLSRMVELSGAAPVLVGFGLEEDNIHAPNESFLIEQFERGFRFASMYLGSL